VEGHAGRKGKSHVERAGVCGRIIQVDLVTVLCTRGGGIEVAG
jgi:hypothetical protein